MNPEAAIQHWLSRLCRVNYVLLTFLTKKQLSKRKVKECAEELENIAKDMKRFLESQCPSTPS